MEYLEERKELFYNATFGNGSVLHEKREDLKEVWGKIGVEGDFVEAVFIAMWSVYTEDLELAPAII